mmetsp:Transcript_87399/g.234017  ORF Transcript_87399/g.234017 Transcript_87399/m.234017 type:complete len:231 (+) Transcript_87399:747-1439(+)
MDWRSFGAHDFKDFFRLFDEDNSGGVSIDELCPPDSEVWNRAAELFAEANRESRLGQFARPPTHSTCSGFFPRPAAFQAPFKTLVVHFAPAPQALLAEVGFDGARRVMHGLPPLGAEPRPRRPQVKGDGTWRARDLDREQRARARAAFRKELETAAGSLEEALHILDVGGNGDITPYEFDQGLRRLANQGLRWQNTMARSAQELFKILDVNKSLTVELDELRGLLVDRRK